ncbi:hypothetical protein PoB_006324300 [Plakobranchus ocellatus]|uniref:Uncharacterized protein n=1 Tax=Plakobranchus ocellatus TaxID=259542 RepID=A0AAV4CXU0_9GAST|nr:hypothetical protein PoB_006324300 [Plakobranchus ocellatus]
MQYHERGNIYAVLLLITLLGLCSGSHPVARSWDESGVRSRSYIEGATTSQAKNSGWLWFKSLLSPQRPESMSRSRRQLESLEARVNKVRRKRQVLGTSSGIPIRQCGFVPFNNETFVESVYKYFSSDSGTNILEYDITLVNAGQEVDLVEASNPDVYKPFRWYRTQGEGSSELLQVNHYYFGLISPFMDLGLSKAKVRLNVTSPTCLQGLARGEIESLLTDYLLTDFEINPKAVEHPYTKADVVQVCHMTIRDDDGWGKLNYRCCGFEADILHCSDVHEDEWVWILRAFIMAVTILLFLYFPVLLPRGYRFYDYVYYPPDGLMFNFRVTTKADQFRKLPRSQILEPNHINRMTEFRSSLAKLKPDVTYTAQVRRLDINVGADRLLQEDCPVISTRRSLFDTFVRCKIRHADPLEDCCRTNACGQYCLPGRPSWQAWLRAVRTILVMAILALPALPFMYAQVAEDLEYQELDDAIEDQNLERPFNFYVGPVFSKVIVGVLAVMYVIHTIIVIIDGATDGNIGRLYSDVLDVSEKKGTIRRRMENTQSFVKRAFLPVQRCGVLLVPVWILALAAIPIYLVLDFFIKAPMIKVFFEGFKRLLRYSHILRRKPNEEATTACGLVEIYLFFLTIVFVFIVLGIGANFLVHVVAMIIVKVLVDAKLVYRVLPVILLLLLYIRDSFSRVGQKYSDFLAQVMTSMRTRESEDLRRESFKSWDQQMNKIFKILPETITVDPDDEVVDEKPKAENEEATQKKKEKKLFLLKNGGVRMRLGQLLLFLNKNDFLFTSKKFLFSCCTMDCVGAPGFLEDNYIRAVLDFMKIGVFLIFMFLVVMAYGNAYYISPTNQMFVTLVSGLVPLLLRNVFLKRSAVQTIKVDYRFESRLEEKIGAFSQTWELRDIALRDVQETGKSVANVEQTSTFAPKTMLASGDKESAKNAQVIHLVLDISKDPNCLESAIKKHPEPGVDPYSVPDCQSKQTGCCNWRSRLERCISCSCFKEDNSVAAEDKIEVQWDGGDQYRRRSDVNFFWNPQMTVSQSKSGNNSSSNSGHNSSSNSSNHINDNIANGNAFPTDSQSLKPMGNANPEADGHYRALWEDSSSPKDHSRRNSGRWMRLSEDRRLALRRARDAEEKTRAANIVSGIDAYVIGTAMLNTVGAAEGTASGARGRGSLGDTAFSRPDSPDSAEA